MSRYWTVFLAVAFLACGGPRAAHGQGSRTVCTPIGSSVSCATTPQKPGIGESLAGVLEGYAADQRRNQATAAASATRKAQWDLFAPRAIMVIQRGQDSIGAGQGRLDSLYTKEAVATILTLFDQAPMASTQQISEAVEPIVVQYRRIVATFNQRAMSMLGRLSDSLAMSQKEREAFYALASDPLVRARANDWTINDPTMRYLIKAALDSIIRRRPP